MFYLFLTSYCRSVTRDLLQHAVQQDKNVFACDMRGALQGLTLELSTAFAVCGVSSDQTYHFLQSGLLAHLAIFTRQSMVILTKCCQFIPSFVSPVVVALASFRNVISDH